MTTAKRKEVARASQHISSRHRPYHSRPARKDSHSLLVCLIYLDVDLVADTLLIGQLLKGAIDEDGKMKNAGLMVGIKLDLEAEVHLTARVRGDIVIGLY